MWGTDTGRLNREFLDNTNPEFFNYFAKGQTDALAGDERQLAALMLRLAYAHALETLFALLGAAIQAPHCPIGWLMQYQSKQLFSLIRKLVAEQPVLWTKPHAANWLSISREIHRFELPDSAKSDRIKQWFANTWARLAADFVDQAASDEYNSIKHGFRAAPGGSYFRLAAPGESEPFFESRAEFGTKFFAREWLDRPVNFHLQYAQRSWSPVALSARIEIIVVCIGNLLSYLRSEHKLTATVRYKWPEENEGLALAWKSEGLLVTMKSGSDIRLADIEPKSAAEILSLYTFDQAAE
jgi:hypothetical protein